MSKAGKPEPTFGYIDPGTASSISDLRASMREFGRGFTRARETHFLQEAGIDNRDLSSRLARTARPELFYRVQSEGESMWVLNSATMQRMNLHKIQNELVGLARQIYNNPDSGFNQSLLESLMHRYCRCSDFIPNIRGGILLTDGRTNRSSVAGLELDGRICRKVGR